MAKTNFFANNKFHHR